MSNRYIEGNPFHESIVALANKGTSDLLISKRMRTSLATVRVVLSLARAAKVRVMSSDERKAVRMAKYAMEKNLEILGEQRPSSTAIESAPGIVRSSPTALIKRGMPLTQVAALHRLPYREVTALADMLRAEAKPLGTLLN